MRWFTCSPRNFFGTDAFFARDSGLTCHGFRALGIESRAIALAPAHEGQSADMIRGTIEQMNNPAWWGALNLDGLIIYTWGQPKYRSVVEAAMAAGVKVAQVTDTQGLTSPVADLLGHLRAEQAHYWQEPAFKRLFRTIIKLPVSCTIRLLRRDRAHARMVATSDYFFAPTPRAALRFQTLVRRLVSKQAAAKVLCVPIPVNFHFIHDPGVAKKEEVVAVGRWDSLQKRTPLLATTISQALKLRQSTRYRIFGKITPYLEAWHQELPPEYRQRVVLEGLVPNAELTTAYQQARVMLVSAAYEGCHVSSAEALCCGASVVACRSPFLGALEWHISKNSGRLSDKANPQALAQTLVEELAAWDRGERNPQAISEAWTKIFHPEQVVRSILEIFGEKSQK